MLKVFLSNLSFSLFQVFLVFFILQNGGAETLGEYALSVAILNPIQQLFKLGIPKLILAEVSLRKQKGYYVVSFYALIAFVLLGIAVCFLLDLTSLKLILSILCFKALINFRESVFSIYLRQKLFTSYFQSSITANVLMMGLFGITFDLSNELSMSFFICSLILFMFTLRDVFSQVRLLELRREDFFYIHDLREQLYRMFRISLANTLFNFKSNIPKYILSMNFNMSILGVYTAIFQAVSFVEVANQSIVKYYGANLTLSFKGSYGAFRKLESRIYLLIFGLTLCAFVVSCFFGDFLLKLFLGEEFVSYRLILLIMIVERLFYMMNSVPKTVYILLDKIQLNIYATVVVSMMMFVSLMRIVDFVWFNVLTVCFSALMFVTNKFIIKRIIVNV